MKKLKIVVFLKLKFILDPRCYDTGTDWTTETDVEKAKTQRNELKYASVFPLSDNELDKVVGGVNLMSEGSDDRTKDNIPII